MSCVKKVKPASINFKMDSCRSSANVKKRSKKTNFQQMEIVVLTLEKEHLISGKSQTLKKVQLFNYWTNYYYFILLFLFTLTDSQHFLRYFENAKETLLQRNPSFKLAR
jgi:hypothetical protein